VTAGPAGPAVALFFGTRPQVIKASVLREALAATGSVVAIDTGQHYDYPLHQVHYDQLGVAPPDVYLGVGSGSHARQTAAIAVAAEEWLSAQAPRAVVVIGDTNSTLGCALAAAKLRIPVVHVEAGLRARDPHLAEEINRRCVDAIADLLLAPSERAAATLRRERPDACVRCVGDVAYDVLRRALERAPSPAAVPAYDPRWGSEFVYVTLHRAELVDHPERLAGVMRALAESPLPCLFAVHPRTAATLARLGVAANGRVRLSEPLGYVQSIGLLRQAAAVVTDSGGIQREAYWLGVPCVTVRDETEWVETIDCGANRLVAPAAASELPGTIRRAVADRAGRGGWPRDAYGDGRAAERIAGIITERLGAAPRSSP
jgi:UDP-N-acetylglucosamine 2-epimerase